MSRAHESFSHGPAAASTPRCWSSARRCAVRAARRGRPLLRQPALSSTPHHLLTAGAMSSDPPPVCIDEFAGIPRVRVNDVLDGNKLLEIDCADRVYLTLS